MEDEHTMWNELPRCKRQNGCSQHRWHKVKAHTDIQGSLESPSPENRPIWFLLWEGNQVAKAQLVTREWPVCTGSMSLKCAGMQPGHSVWDASSRKGHFPGSSSQGSVVQGCAVQSHLRVCSHGTCSSQSVQPVLCALLGLSRADPSWGAG